MPSWSSKRLGYICEIYQPKTISKKQMKHDGKYVVFGANGIIGRYDQYNHEESELLITCRGATCGSVNFSEPYSWITGNAMVVRPVVEDLDRAFLSYFCRGVLDFSQVITGAAQPQITRQSLAPVKISFPPLPEQKRIVAILDEAFAAIDTAIANTQKNLANARELFESYLYATFSHHSDNDPRLADVCEFSSGGTPSKKNKSFWSGSIPWVSGRDMKSTRLADSALHISQEAVDQSSTRMAPAGSLLALVRGMGLAHGAQIVELEIPCAFNQDIRAIIPVRDVIPRFLLFALRARINFSDNVMSIAAHGTMKIDMNVLKNVRVPHPTINRQREIVRQIDSLDDKSKRLESVNQRKLAALRDLKLSLLHQAFSGRL